MDCIENVKNVKQFLHLKLHTTKREGVCNKHDELSTLIPDLYIVIRENMTPRV